MRIIFLFTFLFSVLNVSAQESGIKKHQVSNDSLLSFHSQKGYFPMLWKNFKVQATSPFHATGRQWLYVAAGATVTAALMLNDERIDRSFRTYKSSYPLIEKSSPQITKFGEAYAFYIVGGVGLYSLIGKDNYALHTSLLASQAMITSGFWVQTFKVIAGRERPRHTYPTNSEMEWRGPFFLSENMTDIFDSDFNSFPSGHTTTAFSVATVFAMQYHDKAAIPIISYTVAGLVGLSRMTEHAHWASDVFTGACLGYLCGKGVVKNYRRLSENKNSSSVQKKYFFNYALCPGTEGLYGFFNVTF